MIYKVKIIAFTTFLLFTSFLEAQDNNQNSNYRRSIKKYTKIYDSINSYQASTIQNTYQAYDWYEAKLEARKIRKNARLQRQLYRSQRNNKGNYYPIYSSPYSPGLYNSYPLYQNDFDRSIDIPLILGGIATGYLINGLINLL